MPNYVLIQLRALAVRQGQSLRSLVLQAVQSLGVHVEPHDLTGDKRSTREKRKHYAGTPRIKSDERRR